MGSDKEDLARWADLVLDGKPINIDQTIRQQAARIAELEEANALLVRAVIGADDAKQRLRSCPKSDGGPGGQTIDACLARVRHHNVPLAIFDGYETAMAEVLANPIAAAAVREVAR